MEAKQRIEIALEAGDFSTACSFYRNLRDLGRDQIEDAAYILKRLAGNLLNEGDTGIARQILHDIAETAHSSNNSETDSFSHNLVRLAEATGKDEDIVYAREFVERHSLSNDALTRLNSTSGTTDPSLPEDTRTSLRASTRNQYLLSHGWLSLYKGTSNEQDLEEARAQARLCMGSVHDFSFPSDQWCSEQERADAFLNIFDHTHDLADLDEAKQWIQALHDTDSLLRHDTEVFTAIKGRLAIRLFRSTHEESDKASALKQVGEYFNRGHRFSALVEIAQMTEEEEDLQTAFDDAMNTRMSDHDRIYSLFLLFDKTGHDRALNKIRELADATEDPGVHMWALADLLARYRKEGDIAKAGSLADALAEAWTASFNVDGGHDAVCTFAFEAMARSYECDGQSDTIDNRFFIDLLQVETQKQHRSWISSRHSQIAWNDHMAGYHP